MTTLLPPPGRFEISAHYLSHYLEILAENAGADPEAQLRHVMAGDIYVKTRAVAWINKACGIGACVALLMATAFPLLLMHDGWLGSLDKTGAAAVQTSLMGVVGVLSGLHLYYKQRQTAFETLLRYLAYSRKPCTELAELIIATMGKLDTGFDFKATTAPEARKAEPKTPPS